MRIRPGLQFFFARRAVRFRLTQQHPALRSSVKVEGPDPVRMLLVGAGLAVGYGVADHDDAIAGQLARRLATGLGRGVVVDVRTAAVLPIARAVEFIGMNGAHTYEAAIFAPCYLEGSTTPSAWIRQHLLSVVEHLRETGSPRLAVLLLALPVPARQTRLDRAVAAAAAEENEVMRAIAARRTNVLVVTPPPFESVRIARPFDAEYYRTASEALADVLTARLRQGTGARDAAGRVRSRIDLPRERSAAAGVSGGDDRAATRRASRS